MGELVHINISGSGKTEILKTLSNHTDSPFLKVEATQYTEVGYHGKDVENIIHDLVKKTKHNIEHKIKMIKNDLEIEFDYFLNLVILQVLVGNLNNNNVRQSKLEKINKNYFEDKFINVPKNFISNSLSFSSFEQLFVFLKSMPEKIYFGCENETKRMSIRSFKNLMNHHFLENFEHRIQLRSLIKNKIENEAIIFIDELDKIACSKEKISNSRSPSSEGVQRDLLPLVEGTQLKTDIGFVDTSHILFVSAGAFSLAKPDDLLPELLGRFPVKINLDVLRKHHYKKILTEVEFGLLDQYKILLETENIDLEFKECGVDLISEICENLNFSNENLGARRLHEIIEKLLENELFESKYENTKTVIIDKDFVANRLKHLSIPLDLKQYLV